MKRNINKFEFAWRYMKRTALTLFSLVLVNCLVGCEDYLEKKSDNTLVVPSTLNDLQGLLDAGRIMNYSTPCFGEVSSDDYFLLPDTYNSYPTLEQHLHTWTPEKYEYPNDWGYSYQAIYYTNLCLERIRLIPRTASNSAQWDNVKGSALFYRAYYALNLSWVFSKAYNDATSDSELGIVLRYTTDINEPSERSSVKESYDRVIADALEAVDLLPNSPQQATRPSKAAAYGLLARTYLSMRKYDEAFNYADLCLQIKNGLMDYNDPSVVDPNSDIPFKTFNIEVIFHSQMNSLWVNFYQGASGALIDTLLVKSYEDDDLRKAAFFVDYGYGYNSFKGNYTEDFPNLFTGIATDEMYLVRAETHARAGRVNEAMNDLNTLLVTRWNNAVPYPVITASTKEEAVAKILAERRKELLYRGLRWIDIKRLNKDGANIILTRDIDNQIFSLQPNSDYYALPLPDDIIKASGIPQN